MSSRTPSYLKSIIKYCRDAIAIGNSFGNSYEIFLREINSQYSISFCIEQIGELAKKLREEGYADKHPEVPWDKIAGMRNKIAHGYDAIDLEMVFDVCTKNLPELLKNCNYILQQETSLDEQIKTAKASVLEPTPKTTKHCTLEKE